MSKQVNYNENLCAGAAIRDDKGRRISKLFEAPHPKMTVGYAKNLIMPSDPEEQKFNFRQSGGGVIEDGLAVIDKVKGNSEVWNQLFDGTTLKASGTDNGITFTYENGVITANGTATNKSFSDQALGRQKIKLIKGHKYIFAEKTSNENAYVQLYTGETEEGFSSIALTNKAFEIQTCDYTSSGSYADGWLICVRVASGTTLTNAKFRMPFTDLTQMFGAGNEPTTYEEFLQRKPIVEDEYAYNEGEIINNKVEKVVTTGVNLWDEEWELGGYHSSTGEKIASSNQIRSKNMFACLPHTSYYWRIPNKANGTYMGNCFFYDISRAFISRAPVGPSSFLTVTTPSNARFVAFDLRQEYGTTYNHDICINLSDPAINGKYFPYEEHTLDLSWVKEIKDENGVALFEDGMRSAGSAYDEVGAKKSVKRIGIKVFDGTESFTDYLESYGSFAIMANAIAGGIGSNRCISNRYVASLIWESSPDRTQHDKQIHIDSSNNRIWIRDSAFADIDSFKQHLAELYAQGKPLVVYYELTEPIVVEYDEKNLTYPVIAGGTEEAIASEPSSAFRADIGYGIDAVKTILDLKARVEALEGK